MLVFADDLLLLGISANHLQAFIYAFSRTHEYLHDMGARISADKSFLVMTHPFGHIFVKTGGRICTAVLMWFYTVAIWVLI